MGFSIGKPEENGDFMENGHGNSDFSHETWIFLGEIFQEHQGLIFGNGRCNNSYKPIGKWCFFGI